MLDRVKAAEQELRNARAELQEVSRATSAMPGAWNLTQEQKLKLEDIFEGLKEDALEKRATLINEVNMEFGLRAEEICARAATYTEYKDFESEFVREWEVSRKVQALAGLNFVRAVAECVPGGSPGAPLEDIAGFDSEELTSFCGWRVAETSADLLKTHFEKESRAPMDMLALLENCENNWDAKFAQHEAVLTQVHYGKMADFNAGLLAKIGLPDHRLWEAMEREHCTRPDSKDPFESKNYVLKTTPEAEWIAVTNEEVGKAVSGGLRRVKSIADLRKHSRAEEAGLLDQEILALVLYTGFLPDPPWRQGGGILSILKSTPLEKD
ncbi:hypothetical protein T484DRAFT_3297682 [Baffinella frigidus]|nr:hypothetical protein T484DRAFT_3297682 [Cryptophyta sp. CCMP2293]